MQRNSALFLIASLSTALLSCSGDNQNKDIPADSDTTIVQTDTVANKTASHIDMVISDIPFPFEVLEDLHSSGISFQQDVMNPLSNTARYNQYNSKALNLGVYGADLAYVVTYEQFQQIGAHVKNAKKLAEDLNIPFAFNQEMMDRYVKSKDNKDSLTRIVYDSYHKVDKTLKDDERVGIAALVVTGSWLEGLYLSSKTFAAAQKTKANAGLYSTIAGQKRSLVIVVKLLSEYKNDPYIAKLMDDLNDIASSYNNTSLNEQGLIAINQKVEKLRSRIVEGV